jgi:hypothetical protein
MSILRMSRNGARRPSYSPKTRREGYREAAQIAATDNSDLAIMAHHPILDHNGTVGSLDHQPNSEGL